jgi:dephospho-CoA kinase
MKPVVGLIGGIGSGKSRVAAELARHGARVIAADQVGHEALRHPDIRDRVVRRWGPQILDAQGAVDRRRLGAIVFADGAELKALEALVHPWMDGRIAAEIAAARADPAVALVVLDAAILLEAGWNRHCDWLVYVHAPRDVRLRRLAEQRGWSTKEVAARGDAQLPLTDKVSRADFVVDNTASAAELTRQVEELLSYWIPSPPARRPAVS